MRACYILLLALIACEETPRAAKETKDADPPDAPPPAPAQEGCTRTGSIDGADMDPACVLPRASDNVMRDVMRSITVTAEIDPPTVMAGTSAIMRIAIVNNAQSETLFVFDAMPRPVNSRPDWSRIAGPPEPKIAPPDVPHILFQMTTLDAHDKNVDAIPTIPAGAVPVPPQPKLIGIRVRGGGKLTIAPQWWAMRVPAPLPPVTDDAGHRYVPKTSPIPLWPGDYTVTVDVPFHGMTPPERIVTTKAHVERANTK
jgi:hypothetical protein